MKGAKNWLGDRPGRESLLYNIDVPAKIAQSTMDRELYRTPIKQLVKDGIWCVAAKDRPSGWEKLGVKEPEAPESKSIVGPSGPICT